MVTTSRTTELEAINIMLASIGDPLVTQAEIDSPTDKNVIMAVQTLDEAARIVQNKGWPFNTTKKRRYTPNESNYITVDDSILAVDPIGSYALTYGQVGIDTDDNRLWYEDRETGEISYEFEDTYVEFETRSLIPWSRLPEAARYFITIVAARKFAARSTASEVLLKFTSQDYADAMVNLKQDQSAAADHTLFDSPIYRRTLLNKRSAF